MTTPVNPTTSTTRTRFLSWKSQATARLRVMRTRVAERLHPDPVATVSVLRPAVDPETEAWLHAHRDAPTMVGEVPEATALIFATDAWQQWAGETLTLLGWSVTPPAMVLEGLVPARGERLSTGQPVTTFTTPSRTWAGRARRTDPGTSKTAGAAAAAHTAITVNSHQGQLLFAYATQHRTHPGVGYTAAEAVSAAGLLTDGATGSPWRRVTDLRDMGLVTMLLTDTGERAVRKNESNTDGGVLVITPLGLNAVTALSALRDHGYHDYPLSFDGGPADEGLFEALPATLARIDALPPLDPPPAA